MTYQQVEFVCDIMWRDPVVRDVLLTVRALELRDWAIGAGFVRNAVWDHLHGFARRTALDDIDVLYFDSTQTDPQADQTIEQQLCGLRPRYPWSVRNQARMHLRNRDRPYRSTLDALRFWLELPTCVAVRLDYDDRIEVLAPYGLGHLLAMHGAPTPSGRAKPAQYNARMAAKNWPATWPQVRVDHLEA